MHKHINAAAGIAALTAGAALTMIFGGQQAHADNYFGGAGTTITQGPAPTTLDIPSVSPSLKAQPFAGGEGNGH
jgi:hypothetical protein